MHIQRILVILALAMSVAGCTSAPIMNVSDQTVAAPPGKAMTQDQVKTAILRAGSALGWVMKEEKPGLIVGTLSLRDHIAVVDIPYSAKSYSITYKSSVNLNETNGQIHRNYNGWIQNLQKGIGNQLNLV